MKGFLRKIGIGAIMLFVAFWGFSQSGSHCGYDSLNALLNKNHPEYLIKQKESQQRFAEVQKDFVQKRAIENDPLVNAQFSQRYFTNQRWRTFVIPVVFQVVHNPNDKNRGDKSNVADSVLLNAVEGLNDAFGNSGYYSGGPSNSHPDVKDLDMDIDFRLIRKDGNNSSSIFSVNSGSGQYGICRWPTYFHSSIYYTTYGAMAEYVQGNPVRKAFDPSNTLNIYVVEQIENGNVFALGTDPSKKGEVEDGIAIDYRILSDPELFKYLVHEVGHYLGLLHTYAGGCEFKGACYRTGDFICDTPPCLEPSDSDSSCLNTCSNDTLMSYFNSDQPDLCENFMSGAIVNLQNSFTYLQKMRMHSTLINERSDLLLNYRWVDPNVPHASLENIISNEFGDYRHVCPRITPDVTIKNYGSVPIDSFLLRMTIDEKHAYTKWIHAKIPAKTTQTIDLPSLQFERNSARMMVEILGWNQEGGDDFNRDSAYKNLRVFDTYKTSFQSSYRFRDYWEDVHTNFWEPVYTNNCIEKRPTTQSSLRHRYAGKFPSPTSAIFSSGSLDLTDHQSCWLNFRYAYANLNDTSKSGLKITITDDCGDHETTLFERYGDELATVDTFISSIEWEPDCDDWSHVLLNLSEYAGKDNINIRVSAYRKANTAYGNGLFLNLMDVYMDSCRPFPKLLDAVDVCENQALVDPPKPAYLWSDGSEGKMLSVNESGEYWVAYLSENGCMQLDTFQLTVNPNPEKPFIVRKDDLLLCDKNGAEEYKWYLDGKLIENADQIGLKAEQQGLYRLEYIDSNGCSAMSDEFLVSTLSAFEWFDQINTYPNPTSGRFIIDGIAEDASFQVFNAFGQRVNFRQEFESQKHHIQLDVLPGHYLVVFDTEQGIFKKWVDVVNEDER